MYISTHIHTHYSLLDGESSPARLAARAKELGMPALAITDHNHLLGVIDFKKACDNEGILPIFGVELYYTDNINIMSLDTDARHKLAVEKATKSGVVIPLKPKPTKKLVNELVKDYAYPTKQFHILFLAKNEIGYKNLVKLQSEASRLCTYNGRYLCDNNLIERYKEGLIMTTACLGSRTAQHIIVGEHKAALDLILEWQSIFGEDFYLEIQPLLDANQYAVNQFYMNVAKERDIKLIATNDVHYATHEDIDDHDTMLCVGMGKLKNDEERMRYQPEFWLRSELEMREAFRTQQEIYGNVNTKENYIEMCYEAINNTELIYNKIENNVNIGADYSLFPKVDVPEPYTPERWLQKVCWERLYSYLNKYPDLDRRIYEKRLKEELDVINPKGFASYMLVNQEVMDWCKSQEIPTGPGRGSAAGSLVLLLLEITKLVDPVKEKLLFSRFLTKDRTQMPDIDGDYSYKHRHNVIAHLQEAYGFKNVAHIGTVTVMGVKSGLKDFGRVFNIEFDIINNLTTAIDEIMDFAPSINFKHLDKLAEAGERYAEKYARFCQLEQQHTELFRLARKYEGTPRNSGVHASGILIMPVEVSDVFPTITKDGIQTCLFTGKQLDYYSALKLDILGLRTVDIINDTIMSIDSNKSIYDFYDNCPVKFYGAKYFKDLCQAKTDAIFQLESGLFKGAVKEILPKTIDDITAITSLMRPGPLSAHMDKMYAKRKNGEEQWSEPLPNTLDIVEDTFGTIIYQEQCMLIAQRVAGFDGNHADSYLRKALAKKSLDVLKLCQQWFTYGKINAPVPQGYDLENHNQTMYDPEGKYGAPIMGGIANGYNEQQLNEFFSSLEGYASYLFNKSHAFAYSITSCFCAYLAHYYKPQFMAQVLSMEEKKEKIDYYIDVCNKHGIAILPPDVNKSDEDFKAVGNTILYGLKKIAKVGNSCDKLIVNRPYDSLEAMQEKVKPNKSVFENLIKAGCFDFVDTNRLALLNTIYDIRGDKEAKVPRFDVNTYTKALCRTFEQDTIKTLLTYPCLYKQVPINKTITLACTLEAFSERRDKKGNMMGFYKLNIDGETVEALCFSRIHTSIRLELEHAFEHQKVLYLSGKKDDKGKFLVSSNAKDPNKVYRLAELPRPIAN